MTTRLWCASVLLVVSLAACGSDADDGSGTTTSVLGETTTTAAEATSTTAVTTTTAPSATTSTSSTSTSSTAAATTTIAPTTSIDAVVYLVRDERIATVGRTLAIPAAKNTDRATLIAAQIDALAAGPTAAETALGFSTALPTNTVVRSVAITDTTANVDLSSAFASGGGSLSMSLRWTQIVYTVTANSGVAGVSLSIDGQPTTVLGGEGLMIGSPQTRVELELSDAVPLILVDNPVPFAVITSPMHLTGSSNTFEATARVKLTASDGTVMLDTNFMASCGTGCRGSFDERFPLGPKITGPAMITVYEASAKDGEPINVVTFPVTVA